MVRAALILVLLLLLFLHGAVPGLALPTLGQALWSTGFAQSFLNDSLFSVYATNFGAPQPAPISFGLAGAWPMAVFIACGLHPADAYSAVAALWLSVAFLSAYRLARWVGVSRPLAIAAAALWLTMPVIWVHADYSMLSFGIALLPFYFLCALLVFTSGIRVARALLYLVACLIAAFMDGYTFVMFAAGSSILWTWLFVRSPAGRQTMLRWVLPVHVAGLGLSAALYVLYVGGQHEPAPLEAFRAWGLDLAFLAIPTQGVHWLPDLLGLSVPRTQDSWFGDWSVWSSTFALPIVLAALWAWWKTRRTSLLASGIAIVLVAGLYMALGPSLKVHATRQAGEASGVSMPAHAALAPTGSAWLSRHVPGLRDMRGAYRWLALAVFSSWFLLVLALSARKRPQALLASALAAAVALLNLPHLGQKWRDNAENRAMFLRIDAELVQALGRDLRPGARVAFLPYRNDFLVNYLAARLGVVSYNIGGDKNLSQARRHWPRTMQEFREGSVDAAFPGHVMVLLARKEADSVVLPYVDMREAAHRWPSPPEHREALRAALATLRTSELASLAEREHYAVVRLKAGISGAAVLREFCDPPVCVRQSLRHGVLGAPQRLAQGPYHFILRGRATAAQNSSVEIVSLERSARLARFSLSATKPGVLAEGLVIFEYRKESFQVSVSIAAEDAVDLEGYELVPLRLSK